MFINFNYCWKLLRRDIHILQGIAVSIFSFVSNCVKMLGSKNYLNRFIFGRVIGQISVPGS